MEKWRLKGSEHIAGFLSFLRDVQAEYNIAAQAEDEADRKTQDILHRMELWEDGRGDLERMAVLLRGVRRERRNAKDARMEAEPVVSWVMENAKVVNGLEKLLGEVRKAEKSNKNRHYAVKTDILEGIGLDGAKDGMGDQAQG